MHEVIRPLGDRVLVKVEEPKNKTASGLHIPDTAQEKTCRGTVLAVGPGKVFPPGLRWSMDVEEGDVVLFHHYAERMVPGHEGLAILGEDDLLAIISCCDHPDHHDTDGDGQCP